MSVRSAIATFREIPTRCIANKACWRLTFRFWHFENLAKLLCRSAVGTRLPMRVLLLPFLQLSLSTFYPLSTGYMACLWVCPIKQLERDICQDLGLAVKGVMRRTWCALLRIRHGLSGLMGKNGEEIFQFVALYLQWLRLKGPGSRIHGPPLSQVTSPALILMLASINSLIWRQLQLLPVESPGVI